MNKQHLYILVFKDEPLIKVGLAENIYLRAAGLGSQRFDFQASYVVKAGDQRSIRALERILKTFYADHQIISPKPLSSGNTETFHSSILPALIQSIERFAESFPQGKFQIERDLSSMVPLPSEKPILRAASLDRQPRSTQRLTVLYDCSGARETIDWIKALDRKRVARLDGEDISESLTLLLLPPFPSTNPPGARLKHQSPTESVLANTFTNWRKETQFWLVTWRYDWLVADEFVEQADLKPLRTRLRRFISEQIPYVFDPGIASLKGPSFLRSSGTSSAILPVLKSKLASDGSRTYSAWLADCTCQLEA